VEILSNVLKKECAILLLVMATVYPHANNCHAGATPNLPAPTSVALADRTPPTVTAFAIPTHCSSQTVPILTLTATDNVAVVGYLLTESSSKPSVSDRDWSATPPASYTFSISNPLGMINKTLYAWSKDAAGNVSSTSNLTTATVSLFFPYHPRG
jgi:hypothetical protein